ncbi:hypothetical protein BDN67DRAFT_984025 [Paxillus ammoniavirescens]|nr:hypothetical protein BDN67DRAFT_984025 [Paxillus ammoniavirescens]
MSSLGISIPFAPCDVSMLSGMPTNINVLQTQSIPWGLTGITFGKIVPAEIIVIASEVHAQSWLLLPIITFVFNNQFHFPTSLAYLYFWTVTLTRGLVDERCRGALLTTEHLMSALDNFTIPCNAILSFQLASLYLSMKVSSSQHSTWSLHRDRVAPYHIPIRVIIDSQKLDEEDLDEHAEDVVATLLSGNLECVGHSLENLLKTLGRGEGENYEADRLDPENRDDLEQSEYGEGDDGNDKEQETFKMMPFRQLLESESDTDTIESAHEINNNPIQAGQAMFPKYIDGQFRLLNKSGTMAFSLLKTYYMAEK